MPYFIKVIDIFLGTPILINIDHIISVEWNEEEDQQENALIKCVHGVEYRTGITVEEVHKMIIEILSK
jgi:hypothetical protein